MAFFDSVGKKISQVSQDALQKTKEMADIARLNSAIAEEEKRLNNNYYQIGKLYAQTHSVDYEDCFTSYITAINDSLKKINDAKAEIQVLRAVGNCPVCGAEVPNSSMYCNVCGAAMPNAVAKTAPSADSVKCANCGSFVDKKMRFCTSCGMPMAQSAVDNSPVVAPVENPVVNPAVNPVVTPVEPIVPNFEARCQRCGAILDADAVFCAECGARVR